MRDGATRRREYAIVHVLALAVACGPVFDSSPLPPLDPSANFAAHRVHGGLAIDRLERASSGFLEGRDFGMFVLRAGDALVAAMWLTAPATVVARAGSTSAAAVTARVEPSWPEQSIRLTLTTAAGTVRTGPFARADGLPGMPALARTGQTNLDARGTYRAELTDDGGTPCGWFEVRVPSADESRLFSGVLPRAPIEAGPALALALDSELDWIDDHTIDVYRGRDGRGGVGRGR